MYVSNFFLFLSRSFVVSHVAFVGKLSLCIGVEGYIFAYIGNRSKEVPGVGGRGGGRRVKGLSAAKIEHTM